MNHPILFLGTLTENEESARCLIEALEEDGDQSALVQVERGETLHVVADVGESVMNGGKVLMTDICAMTGPDVFHVELDVVDAGAGDSNAFVLVSGARRFVRDYPGTPREWRDRAKGGRDCFVVWSDGRDKPTSKQGCWFTADPELGAPASLLTVSERRFVTGVIYTRERMLSPRGLPVEAERFVHVVCRRLQAREIPGGGDDVDVFRFVIKVYERQNATFDLAGDRFAGWRNLAGLARYGFNQTCHVNSELKARTRAPAPRSLRVVPQGARRQPSFTAANQGDSSMIRFLATIRGMSIADALRVVETPLELMTIVVMKGKSNMSRSDSAVELILENIHGDDDLQVSLLEMVEKFAQSA